MHRALGLCLGAWFALVGVSGAALVFAEEIDAWLNPQMLRSDARGRQLDAARIVAAAEALHPGGHVERLRWPLAQGEVFRVTMRIEARRVGAQRAELAFDPVLGTHLGSRSLERFGLAPTELVRTLYEFHRNVLLGAFGSNLVGIAGALLLASAVSGTVLAAPRTRSGWKRLIAIKRPAGATRLLFDIHRSLGSSACVLLFLATVTGITLVYLSYVRDLVGVFSPVAAFPTVPWRVAQAREPLALAAIEREVRRAYAGRAMVEVHIPSKPTAGYLFYLRGAGDVHRAGDTLVWVHPGSGEVLLERAAHNRTMGESFLHWLFPLHSGTAFGLPGRIAMCLTGLAPIVLVTTGLWIWTRKRRSEAIEQRRRDAVHASRRQSAPVHQAHPMESGRHARR